MKFRGAVVDLSLSCSPTSLQLLLRPSRSCSAPFKSLSPSRLDQIGVDAVSCLALQIGKDFQMPGLRKRRTCGRAEGRSRTTISSTRRRSSFGASLLVEGVKASSHLFLSLHIRPSLLQLLGVCYGRGLYISWIDGGWVAFLRWQRRRDGRNVEQEEGVHVASRIVHRLFQWSAMDLFWT